MKKDCSNTKHLSLMINMQEMIFVLLFAPFQANFRLFCCEKKRALFSKARVELVLLYAVLDQ